MKRFGFLLLALMGSSSFLQLFGQDIQSSYHPLPHQGFSVAEMGDYLLIRQEYKYFKLFDPKAETFIWHDQLRNEQVMNFAFMPEDLIFTQIDQGVWIQDMMRKREQYFPRPKEDVFFYTRIFHLPERAASLIIYKSAKETFLNLIDHQHLDTLWVHSLDYGFSLEHQDSDYLHDHLWLLGSRMQGNQKQMMLVVLDFEQGKVVYEAEIGRPYSKVASPLKFQMNRKKVLIHWQGLHVFDRIKATLTNSWIHHTPEEEAKSFAFGAHRPTARLISQDADQLSPMLHFEDGRFHLFDGNKAKPMASSQLYGKVFLQYQCKDKLFLAHAYSTARPQLSIVNISDLKEEFHQPLHLKKMGHPHPQKAGFRKMIERNILLDAYHHNIYVNEGQSVKKIDILNAREKLLFPPPILDGMEIMPGEGLFVDDPEYSFAIARNIPNHPEGEYLFCLDKEGQIIWSQKLGEEALHPIFSEKQKSFSGFSIDDLSPKRLRRGVLKTTSNTVFCLSGDFRLREIQKEDGKILQDLALGELIPQGAKWNLFLDKRLLVYFTGWNRMLHLVKF